MKKIVTFLFAAIMLSSVMGQEQGWFFTLGGNYGHNTFSYTLDNGVKSAYPLGWGAGLKLQYFWNKHWGLSFGAEWFDYNAKATYTRNWKNPYLGNLDPLGGDPLDGDPAHFITGGMVGGAWTQTIPLQGATTDYELRFSLDKWVEKQHGYVVNVPLMVEYQTKWGKKELVGMYFSLGAKLQIPVLQQTYEHIDGALQVLGYFPAANLTIGDPYTLYQHGFGTTPVHPDPIFEGTFKLKPINVAAAGEIGFLFAFSPRVNLSVGIYADYGILNMKKGNSHESGKLIMPETNDDGVVNPGAMDNAHQIGDGLRYNGFLQSHATDRVDLLAFGVKIGLRIKLGKLRDRDQVDEEKCGPLDKCFIEKLYAADVATRESMQRELIDSIKSAIGAPRSIEYTQMVGPQMGSYISNAEFQNLVDSLRNILNGRRYVDNNKLADGTKTTVNRIAGDTVWDPNFANSPNNPENPNYAYPYWYDPDYIIDPAYVNRIGLESYDEGPNNPVAIARNNAIIIELEKYILEPVYFALDKSTLRPESIVKILHVVDIMKKYPRLAVSLLGHTCDIASNDYNDKLSARRAQTVCNYMIKKGVKKNRIGLLPLGKINPTYPNDNEEDRAKNRRVDFILTK
ncbi:MAG: OmpA family protein [Bacteroidales bacterium]|nr:OmpA family protein [Bacteroidales bacterium]